jgi:predicted RNA-binding Zn ribbon-like protein
MDASDLIGVGDHAALDFVNSTAQQHGQVFELLHDGPSYLRWMRLADLIDDADAGAIEGRFARAELDAVAAEAVRIREWSRLVIADWSGPGGGFVSDDTRRRLNELLAVDSRYANLTYENRITDRRRWTDVRLLLVPPVAAVAALLSGGDPNQVRNCDGAGCPLWFYDRTKAHRRRWCSMAWCGNRSKARDHRIRQASR